MHGLVSLLGVVLVMATLRELFHTIWHPTRRGGASRLVMRALWRGSRRAGAREPVAALVGPLSMVAVMVLWASAIVAGWALIYWPHMPHGFTFQSALEPSARSDLLDSVYVSLVMVATLGLGDVAPTTGWLRIITPLEALVGFVLLSAVVSWVLGIYPALACRRWVQRHCSDDRHGELDVLIPAVERTRGRSITLAFNERYPSIVEF